MRRGDAGSTDFVQGSAVCFRWEGNIRGDRVRYFLLEGACPAKNKSKIKVRKWLDLDGAEGYEAFLVRWHGLTRRLRQYLTEHAQDEETARGVNLSFLQIFFMKPYAEGDFYCEFAQRMEAFAQRVSPAVILTACRRGLWEPLPVQKIMNDSGRALPLLQSR